MTPQRHAEILRILEAEGAASISALAARLSVSAETVRRDLRALAEAGAVLRTHGGAGLVGQSGEAPFRARMRENAAAKQAIAAALAARIRSGETLMLDTGTTTSFLARALVRHRRLTVITNSTDAARVLSAGEGNRVFLAGGQLRPDSGAILGARAVEFVRGFCAGLGVISAGGVDSLGVSDFDIDEADFASALLERCNRRVVVTESAKFGRCGLVSVAGFDRIDEVVTDAPPPETIAAAMQAGGTILSLAS
jgi:DeoR family glycerol-3-phosphate regulon repressor